MSEARISIIVPVYNTAQYLSKCLDSLVKQSFSDIEIICVNDGSTDASLEVLNAYALRDQRIVVINQPYQGVSVARNRALSVAQAPYIMSCDSDDWFCPDMCQVMLETLLKEDVDVVICGWKIEFQVDEQLKQGVEEYLRLKYTGLHQVTWRKILNTDVSLCNKIYRRSHIDKYCIDFPDGLLFEDAYFNDAYLTVSKTAYYLNRPLYNYLRHEESVMSTSYKKTGTALDYLQIAFKTHEYLERNSLCETFNEFFWHRFNQYCSFALDHLEHDDRQKAINIARAFVVEHSREFAAADKSTQIHILGVLHKRYRIYAFIRKVCDRLYGLMSPSRKLQHRSIEVCQEISDQQTQLHAILGKTPDLHDK